MNKVLKARISVITLFDLYYIIGLIIYNYGPISWPSKNKFILNFFLVSIFLSINFGYLINFYTNINSNKIKFNFEKTYNISKILVTFFNMILIYNILNSSEVSIFYTLSQNYFSYNSNIRTQLWFKLLSYYKILLAFFIYIYFPLSFFNFYKLERKDKMLFFLNIGLTILLFIHNGTVNIIFNLIIIFLLVLFIKLNKKINKKNFLIGILIIFLLISFIAVFYQVQKSRSYSTMETNKYYELNDNFSSLKSFSSDIYFLFVKLANYLTQGIHGLDVTFSLDSNFTYFVGFSDFLLNNFSDYIDSNVFESSYQYKISKTGWPVGAKWISIFPYLFNDLGVIFTLVLFFWIGFYYNKTFAQVLINKCEISFLIFLKLTFLLLFIFSNNYIFQSGYNFVSSIIIFGYYFFYDLFVKNKIGMGG
ncbi:hypothetical protein [Halanaerobium kushneri]|uniref:Oligosaccharide repeat unit polymerase n=1 Tax=Halanaerobium kushneri TaxID=56779 RepID=A0A1N6RPQ9_9FIRM|nr:hypothetical protein [Halanaerobium kushneri]SIQ30785.1 hypothetical protein SAMN05421834_10369 [Halanaerobium kushneri]